MNFRKIIGAVAALLLIACLAAGPRSALAQDTEGSSGQILNSATSNAALPVTLLNAQSVIAFNVAGLTASGATLTIEGSADGQPIFTTGTTTPNPSKTWKAIAGMPLPGVAGAPSTTLTADQTFRVDVAALDAVRLRVSSTGSGNITIGYRDIYGAAVTPSNTSTAPLYVAGNESGTAPVQTATPANASHTAGQSVGGLFTIPMLRVAGGGGLFEYLDVRSIGGDTPTLQARVWDRKPTNSNFACTDNAAYADGSGSTGGTVGNDQSHELPTFPQSVTLLAPSNITGDAKTEGYIALLPPISVKNQDGTPTLNLYVCLVATTTYTPGGAAYYVNAIGPQD